MPEYLTAKEIEEYHSRGITFITVKQMPVLTDEAREVMKRLGFEIRVEPPGPAVNIGTLQTPAPVCSSRPQSFKQRMQSDRRLVGTFIQIAHPVMTEFVGKLGFDLLIIDAEHSAMDIETIQAMLQGLAATPSYGIVRIPAISSRYIASYLDAGADAILVPQVRSAEEVRMVGDAALYPPDGKRGIGPGRATDFGLNILGRKVAPNKDTVVIIQIETREALNNLEEILAVEFFDMVFIGSGDLSMNLGIFGEFSHPILTGEITNIIKASKGRQKKVGIFAWNVEMAAEWLSHGVDMVVINSELGLMAQFVKQSLAKLDVLLKKDSQKGGMTGDK